MVLACALQSGPEQRVLDLTTFLETHSKVFSSQITTPRWVPWNTEAGGVLQQQEI